MHPVSFRLSAVAPTALLIFYGRSRAYCPNVLIKSRRTLAWRLVLCFSLMRDLCRNSFFRRRHAEISIRELTRRERRDSPGDTMSSEFKGKSGTPFLWPMAAACGRVGEDQVRSVITLVDA